MEEIERYKKLIGKSRNEVIAELGQEFNYYHSSLWSYTIKRDWWGRWLTLVIVFEEDKVEAMYMKKLYYFK